VRRRTRIVLLTGLLLVAALVVLGWLHGNRLSGTVGERLIVAETAHALSGAHMEIVGSTASVTLGKLTATVDAERIELPDGTTISIPSACRTIELHERGGRIEVRFDGVEAR